MFILVATFTGHVGPIHNLSWTDGFLFSCGSDRNIYGWDMNLGARVDNMNVLMSLGLCRALVVTSLYKSFTAVAFTSDGALHKLTWSGKTSEESNTLTLCAPREDGISSVCLSQDKNFLFAGTSNGTIRCYTWGKDVNCISQISLHCKVHASPHPNQMGNAISSLLFVDNMVASAGFFDGSMFLTSLKSSHFQQENSGHLHHVAPLHADNVLISADDYNNCRATISELEERIKTLNNDHEFESHSKDMLWKNELKELNEKTDEVIRAEQYVGHYR